MTAALGVILDIPSNTQKFFGGGQVDNQAKNVSNDESCHTDDITAIAISSDRNWAASGQVGSAPCAFVWDAKTGQKKQRFKLAKGARGVNAIAFSNDGSLVALSDNSDDHNVYVFDVNSGALKFKDKGDTNKIFDLAFTGRPGENTFATAGSKHIKFWYPDQMKGEKGLFVNKGEQTSFACVAYDDKGVCYTGGCNSQIYVWPGKELQTTIKAHDGGFICALTYAAGKLYSGGKDGNVVVTDTATLTVLNKLPYDGVLIRAIDMVGTKGLIGLRNGSILHVDAAAKTRVTVMEGHSDGEVWGLGLAGPDHVVTSGDDNKVKAWNINTRKCEATAIISTETRKAPKGGASSLTELPDSQCARAGAVNAHNGHVAVGHNDGTLTIRTSVKKLGEVAATFRDSQEWIEAIEYSPDGNRLAVGSHDNNIYIYNANSPFNLLGKLTKHNSFIVSVDWSVDGKYIRSVCGAHELLFFTTDDFKQDPSGATNTKGTEWASGHAKYGWLVDGIFPAGVDGTHINSVDFSADGTLISTGDDYGLVNVFRNPARSGAKPICLRGHSEHVVRTRFHNQDQYLFSVGGYDQTLMQFKRR